jgi:hypothetical protein
MNSIQIILKLTITNTNNVKRKALPCIQSLQVDEVDEVQKYIIAT